MQITTKIEGPRGCGYRKPGGIYLVSDGRAATCYRLPIPLTVCPCCGQGIKQTRGFTWIQAALFKDTPCNPSGNYPVDCCGSCAANLDPMTRIGLLWVGEVFYKTSEAFTRESAMQGISRRISQVPRELKVGETWIALAHPKAVTSIDENGEVMQGPGIFSFFRPQRIEYVVDPGDTPEKLQALEDRGFTLVKVIRDIDAQTQLDLN